jgi:CRISPR/Cas system CSM-associated protein Csm4 (group 5 of RAMP superfamily)
MRKKNNKKIIEKFKNLLDKHLEELNNNSNEINAIVDIILSNKVENTELSEKIFENNINNRKFILKLQDEICKTENILKNIG